MSSAVLLTAHHDPDFRHAAGFDVEDGIYLRFPDGSDLVVTNRMELGRARATSRAAQVLDKRELGYVISANPYRSWAAVIHALCAERGLEAVRVTPRLAVGYADELRALGLAVQVDPELNRDRRRRKSEAEVAAIARAQAAAEAACVAVIAELAAAEVVDGELAAAGRRLTSEGLFAVADQVLAEHGCSCPEMIIAGAPECAQPHFRGAGRLRAGVPIIIDIFPRDRATGYHGDLTRTVVVGVPDPEVQIMHDACLRALQAALAALRPGANQRDVHLAACQELVEAGFGTLSPGLEGSDQAPRMIHSTGHGVGLEVHEPPSLTDLDGELVEGDAVTVEPGLYLDRLGGVRVEDLAVVTAEGHRNLTSLPYSLDPAAYLNRGL